MYGRLCLDMAAIYGGTTFARPDGTMQVAYNGRPLYYFKNDAIAGDTNGQGIVGNWYVAAP